METGSIDMHRWGASVWSPSWSPNGRFIALWGASAHHDETLYLFDTHQNELVPSSVPDESFAGTQWSPDGRYIKMSRYHDQGLGVYVLDVEQNEIRLIAESTIPWPPNRWVYVPTITSPSSVTPVPTALVELPASTSVEANPQTDEHDDHTLTVHLPRQSAGDHGFTMTDYLSRRWLVGTLR
jgi:WD40 repeat protein